MGSGEIILMGACGLVLLALLAITFFSNNFSLNGIKGKTVGDGQYGTARFSSKREIFQRLKAIPFEPEQWRKGAKPNIEDGIILGVERHGRKYTALVDTEDNHTMMVAAPGAGKTTRSLYPNIELACACGISFIATDTKGDVPDRYALIAKKYYHYQCAVLDFRHPLQGDSWNLLSTVNKYMAKYKNTNDISMLAKCEKSAKIVAAAIIGNTDMGQNSFFYQAAQGLLAGIILLVAEFAQPEESHIVSVLKITLELLREPKEKENGKNKRLRTVFEKLPPEHKAYWLASSAIYSSEQSMFSVISTAISRMLNFIDSEMEQILCFDSTFEFEGFDQSKNALFLIIPEEDKVKHFLISLIVEQTYGELLQMAGGNKNQLHKRVRYFLDEFGTMPPISTAEEMFTAGRSRGILLYPIIQELSQLEGNYKKSGKTTITGVCQNILGGGFSPLSETAKEFSEALDKATVQSGSISIGGGANSRNSRSLQMAPRALMTPDELKNMPMGDFICIKTGMHPFRTHLEYYEKLGITFTELRQSEKKALRTVHYANLEKIESALENKYNSTPPKPKEEPPISAQTHSVPKRDPSVWNT